MWELRFALKPDLPRWSLDEEGENRYSVLRTHARGTIGATHLHGLLACGGMMSLGTPKESLAAGSVDLQWAVRPCSGVISPPLPGVPSVHVYEKHYRQASGPSRQRPSAEKAPSPAFLLDVHLAPVHHQHQSPPSCAF